MKLVNLYRPVKSPRGQTIMDGSKEKPYKFIELLYTGIYGEPANGMDAGARSKANRLGIRVAKVLEEIEGLETDKERAEVEIVLSAEEISLIKTLSAFAFNTLLFGAVEQELENGKLPDEEGVEK